MSYEYDQYLRDHITAVQNAAMWMQSNLDLGLLHPNTLEHDQSKYGIAEYDAYDEYFYPRKRTESAKKDFQYAWLHHIHNNPHHWQYWVLINDDPKEGQVPLEMPKDYVIEMIADWWSFSWRKGKLYEIFDWYDQHKQYMILHENTRKLVEDILGQIKAKLDAQQSEETA